MARATKETPSTQRSTRSSGRKGKGAKEVEVVSVEAADAPTQRVQSRRKNTRTTPQTPKTPRMVAKKRGSHSVPQEDSEEEAEAEDEQNEPEPPPKRGRGAPRKTPRMTGEEKERHEFQKELDLVVKKAQKYSWARRVLQTVIASPEPPALIGSDIEEEADEQTTPVKHFKKDSIGPKERKKPHPWTDDEEAFLVELICKDGAKWSHFEKMYGRAELFGRNQTAIKDKARNIMRKIIDNDREEEWLTKFPMWAQVTVGQARRGVHAYQNGQIPDRQVKRSYAEMVE